MALGLVTSLMLVTASPALAQQAVTGAGSGHGWEFPPELSNANPCGPPIPGELPSDRFELYHNGTYNATNNPGTATIASYVGPTTVHITVDTHLVSPAGAGTSCLVPVGPVPIRNAKIRGDQLGGHVSCEYNSGFYTRVNSAVSFQLNPTGTGQGQGTCTVKGNVALFTANVTNVRTYHTISGTMNPCAFPVIDPTTGEPIEPIEFVPNPECSAYELVNAPGGGRDAGSHLITTYQAYGATTP